MKLEVRPAEYADLEEIKRQIDEYLALDFYTLESLRAILADEKTIFLVMTDADRDGKIVSYFYAFVSTLEEALSVLHVSKKPKELMKYPPETIVGVYKTSSTVREYRRLGICSTFIRDVEPLMKDRGAKMILATAMRTPEGIVPMHHIFSDHGYRAAAEIIRPWEKQYMYCHYCGRHHCICDAVFYIKNTDEAKDGADL